MIRVEGFGILRPNGHNLVLPLSLFGERPPKEVSGGQSFKGWFPPYELAWAVKANGYGAAAKLEGYLRGAQGKRYTSRTIAFDPERWLSSSAEQHGCAFLPSP